MNTGFVILSDPSCDLSKELRERFKIEIIHGHYTTPDGIEHETKMDWTQEERETFYYELKKNPNGFTTAPPNVEECVQAFEKYAKDGCPILSFAISTGISGTFANMTKAKEEVLKKYPSAKIFVIDSLRFSAGYAIMEIVASQMREEGKTIEEVSEYIEDNKNRVHQTGWMDDLPFVAKKGRLSNAKAFFGTLAGVKPIGEFDYNGLTTVIGKVKGEKNAYAALLEYMNRHIENAQDQIILIATSLRQKQAAEFKEMITNRFSPKEVLVLDVYQTNGVNIGPGLMAAYYFGKPITHGLEEEKKCLSDIVASL